jgi:hypothetical protein
VAAGLNEEMEVLGSSITGGDFQGAYAVTNNVGVMANVYFAGATDDETGGEGKGRLFEGGVGYYRPLSDRLVFETYGGGGFGTVTHIHGQDPSRASVSAQRAFLQPSMGFTSNWFDAALSLRLCGLHYSGIPENLTNARDIDAARELADMRSSFLAEPSLTVRGGWKYLRLQVQLGFSKNLTHADFPQVESYVSIGGYVAMKPRYR